MKGTDADANDTTGNDKTAKRQWLCRRVAKWIAQKAIQGRD